MHGHCPWLFLYLLGSMAVGFLLGLSVSSTPNPVDFFAFPLPHDVRSFFRWWDAWWTLSVRERNITGMIDAWSGASLQPQLSIVSVSVVSVLTLACREFGYPAGLAGPVQRRGSGFGGQPKLHFH